MGAWEQGTRRVARISVMAIRPAGWADLEAAAELLGAQNRVAVGVAGVRAEHLRSEWELPGFALGEDNIVAEEHAQIVGYATLSPHSEVALAAADDALADELLERIVARARARGDAAITVSVLSDESPLARLAERHPFEVQHETLLMWRPLGAPVGVTPRPEGIAIRTFRLQGRQARHRPLDAACGARG